MLNKYGIIYKITNLINSKVYIGQTKKELQKRWSGHCNKNGCVHLYAAIKKYGKDNFKIEQIDIAVDKKNLDNKEIFWINYYNSTDKLKGYNLTYGGQSGKKCEDVKIRMSKSKLGKKLSDETKSKISSKLKNKRKPDGFGSNISNKKTGMKYNWKNKFYWNEHPEKKKAMADARRKYKTKEDRNKIYSSIRKEKRRILNKEFKKLGKVVGIKCITTNQEFKTYKSAAEELKINVCALREHIIGLYSNAGGYKFEAIFNTLENEGAVNE
jgi:group I intron endonuclease